MTFEIEWTAMRNKGGGLGDIGTESSGVFGRWVVGWLWGFWCGDASATSSVVLLLPVENLHVLRCCCHSWFFSPKPLFRFKFRILVLQIAFCLLGFCIYNFKWILYTGLSLLVVLHGPTDMARRKTCLWARLAV